jgi:hypothetical protein
LLLFTTISRALNNYQVGPSSSRIAAATLYDEYCTYIWTSGTDNPCGLNGFGRVMSLIFPNVKKQKVYHRVSSYWAYSGIQAKIESIDKENEVLNELTLKSICTKYGYTEISTHAAHFMKFTNAICDGNRILKEIFFIQNVAPKTIQLSIGGKKVNTTTLCNDYQHSLAHTDYLIRLFDSLDICRGYSEQKENVGRLWQDTTGTLPPARLQRNNLCYGYLEIGQTNDVCVWHAPKSSVPSQHRLKIVLPIDTLTIPMQNLVRMPIRK